MANSKSFNTSQTRKTKKRINPINKESSFVTDQNLDASVFDYVELDDEEFDVKSARRSFRKKRVRVADAKIKHQTVSKDYSKNEKTGKGIELRSSKLEKDDCGGIDLAKDLFTTVMNDDRRNRKDMSIENTKHIMKTSMHQRNKETIEKNNMDGVLNSPQLGPKESVIDKSIKKLEMSKHSNRHQESSVNEHGKENKTYSSEAEISAPDSIRSIESQKKCPICMAAFSNSQSDHEINLHVNACLDMPENLQGETEPLGNIPPPTENIDDKIIDNANQTDEDAARKLQEREATKAIEEKLSDQLWFCGICQKDLNRLNAESRQVHMNRCADLCEKENALMAKAKRLSLKESGKEFECLICGEMFSSMLQRMAHVKHCCKRKNVNRKELLQLIKETTAASSTDCPEVDNQLNVSGKTVNDVLKANPSSSLKSDTNEHKIEARRRKRTTRKKASNEEVPVLLTRSEEESRKIAMSKATKLIEEQLNIHSAMESSGCTHLPSSKLALKYKRAISDGNQSLDDLVTDAQDSVKEISSKSRESSNYLKNVPSLWHLSDNTTPLLETSKFYVPNIFPDDLESMKERLRKKQDIDAECTPRRPKEDKSVKGTQLLQVTNDDNLKYENRKRLTSASASSKLDESLTMTQSEKVAILGNLGVSCDETEEGSDQEMGNEGCNGFIETDSNEKQNSDLEKKLNQMVTKAKDSLISSLKLLFKDDVTKDARLLCIDGKVLRAHRCILFARCPALKTDATEIHLTRYTANSVAVALKYIYTSEIDTKMDDVTEVHQLANWLSLDLLAEACSILANEDELRFRPLNDGANITKPNFEDLEKTLWVVNESEDAEEDDELLQMECRDGGDSPFDESDEEDLRFFIATQREIGTSVQQGNFEKRQNDKGEDAISNITSSDSCKEEPARCLANQQGDRVSSSSVPYEKSDIVNSSGFDWLHDISDGGVSVSISANKDAPHEAIAEDDQIDMLLYSSGLAIDESSLATGKVLRGKSNTKTFDILNHTVKVKFDGITEIFDQVGSDIVNNSTENIIEIGANNDKDIVDINEGFCDKDELNLTTDMDRSTPEHLGNPRTVDSGSSDSGSPELNRINKSVPGCGDLTDLPIDGFNDFNLKLDSDEEDLFNSNSSGGLDMAICLDENEEDSNTGAKDQHDICEDNTQLCKSKANLAFVTPVKVTPKPFETTVATPILFSSRKYDTPYQVDLSLANDTPTSNQHSKHRESTKNVDVKGHSKKDSNCCDINDSDTYRSDSDLAVNQSSNENDLNDSTADRSATNFTEPVSPCVTTSQFDRKGNSEGSVCLDKDTNVFEKFGFPSIKQTTVIDLDEVESSDEEKESVGDKSLKGINIAETSSVSKPHNKLSGVRPRNLVKETFYQKETSRLTEADVNINDGTERTCNAVHSGLKGLKHTWQTSNDAIMSEVHNSDEAMFCSPEQLPKNTGKTFPMPEISKGMESRDSSSNKSTTITLKKVTRVKETVRDINKEQFFESNDNSSDEIVDVTPEKLNTTRKSGRHITDLKISQKSNGSDNEVIDVTAQRTLCYTASEKGRNYKVKEANIVVSSSNIPQKSSPNNRQGSSSNKTKRPSLYKSSATLSKKRKSLFEDKQPTTVDGNKRRYLGYDGTSGDDKTTEEENEDLLNLESNHGTKKAQVSPSKGKKYDRRDRTGFKSLLKCISSEQSSQNRVSLSSSSCDHQGSESPDSLKKGESPPRSGNQHLEDSIDGCKMISYQSFADSFDDGGFNADIYCGGPVSNNGSVAELSEATSKSNLRDLDDKGNHKEINADDDFVDVDNGIHMITFVDDGGFNCDIQEIAVNNNSVNFSANRSGDGDIERSGSRKCASVTEDNPELSIISGTDVDRCCVDVTDSESYSIILSNIENPVVFNDDSISGDNIESNDSDTSKNVPRRHKTHVDIRTARTSNVERGHITSAQTPLSAVRKFGPGCGVHPETGATITPMSDYEALQTPVLTPEAVIKCPSSTSAYRPRDKRVKQYGLRKLPKHQMAGKLREIFKMKHGFTHWEEPPTKPQRKKNSKQKAANNKKVNDVQTSVQDTNDIRNNDGTSATSSDDEGQKTFEGCYSEDETSSQASSQVDETDETLTEKLLNFVKERKQLYEQILTYQKLNFDEIYDCVKEAKIKCSKSRLTDFLDEQCICFVFPKTDDKPRARKRRRKQKT